MRLFTKAKRYPRRASITDARFVFGLCIGLLGIGFLLFFTPAKAAISATQNCAPQGDFHETVRVASIYDGDTVRLQDGRKLRFIGINTPELHPNWQNQKNSVPPEPYAKAAKAYLSGLLTNNTLHLVYDKERQDRHGRTLAHAFLADGRNLSQLLLEQGLGTTLVVPPNLWRQPCYAKIEQQAHKATRGLWSHPRYQAIDANTLAPETRGYRIVRGKVTRIGQSKSAYWLNLSKRFALRIVRSDLQYFANQDFERLIGQRVEARGWVYARKGELRMRIRHPSALQVVQ